MASMTSVISFIVLLFATYSYSIPVVEKYNATAPVYPFLNNGTILKSITTIYNGSAYYSGYNNASNSRYQPLYTNYSYVQTSTTGNVPVSPRSLGGLEGDETTTYGDITVTPRSIWGSEGDETTTYGDITVTPRSLKGLEGDETTTYGDMTMAPRLIKDSESDETSTYGDITMAPRLTEDLESGETTTYGDVTVTARSMNESSSEEHSTSTDHAFLSRSLYGSELSSSTPSEEENFNEYSSTTMESATEFNQRAIHSLGEEELTSSAPWNGRFQGEISQNVQPSSSVNKFGQSSGLLPNGQTAPGRYVQQGQPAGQLGSQYLSQGQRVAQPVVSNQVPTSQVYVQRPVSQLLTKPQYVQTNQLPVGQVAGQQTGSSVFTQGQRLPQYFETNEVPVSQVSGQQTGSQIYTQGQRFSQPVGTSKIPTSQLSGQQFVSQLSSQGQRFPQSIETTRLQGNVVSTTPFQEFGTNDDMETTTVRGFRQTNFTRHV